MIVRIIGTLEKLLKSQHVQNLEKKPLPAVFVKAQKKKVFYKSFQVFLRLDIIMHQSGLQIDLQPVKKLVQKAAIVKMKTVQQQQSKEVLLL